MKKKNLSLLLLLLSLGFYSNSYATSFGDCVFSSIDSYSGTVTGLSCPTSSGSLYQEFTPTEIGYVKLAFQNNRGEYFVNQNVFGLLVVVATVTFFLFFTTITVAFGLFLYGYKLSARSRK
ncbi:MAG: hypothetical protein PHU93_01175 [Candidatus Gracilibacteria bacterium]|nr:hypothetical protein [Candidatus Gracilibacteria bacterium]